MDEPNNLTINGNISVNSTMIALGANAAAGTVGINSVAIGTSAGQNNMGTESIAIGFNTSEARLGNQSTAVGSYAGFNQTGSCNIFIGREAGFNGYNQMTGSYNTYVGFNTGANSSAYSNSTAVGTGAQITASNQVVLGTTSETVAIPGKINFTAPPIYIRVANGTQSILDGETTLLFHNLDALSSANTGITYNAGTFTNSNSYKITVNIAATLVFNGSLTPTGTRWIAIYADGIARANMAGLCPNATIAPRLCASCNVSIAASGTFYVSGYQNSGGANIPVLNSTQISVLVL